MLLIDVQSKPEPFNDKKKLVLNHATTSGTLRHFRSKKGYPLIILAVHFVSYSIDNTKARVSKVHFI